MPGTQEQQDHTTITSENNGFRKEDFAGMTILICNILWVYIHKSELNDRIIVYESHSLFKS